MFRFTCGEKKMCSSTKISQIIVNMVVRNIKNIDEGKNIQIID